MSRLFDNIDQDLLTALRATMQVSRRADFCVGYLNLRGWQAIDDLIAPWDPVPGALTIDRINSKANLVAIQSRATTPATPLNDAHPGGFLFGRSKRSQWLVRMLP